MRIDPATEIVLLRTQGELLLEDWEAELRQAIAATGGRIRRVLADRRAMQGDFSPRLRIGAEHFFQTHPEPFRSAQFAVLLPPGSPALPAAHTAHVLAKLMGVEQEVFTELAAALEWLLGGPAPEELERLERWVDSYKIL